jgi:hypothetical protein
MIVGNSEVEEQKPSIILGVAGSHQAGRPCVVANFNSMFRTGL